MSSLPPANPMVDQRRLAALAERIEADAWVAMQLATPDWFREQWGIEVRRVAGGVALVAGHLDFAASNRVLGLGLDAPIDESVIDELIETYREAGVRRLVLQWSPAARPPEAPRWLEARGFRMPARMAKMWRRVEPLPPPPSSLRVVQVDAAEACTFGEIARQGFDLLPEMEPGLRSTIGLPGWRHYLALDGDRPVASAALFGCDGVAWCGLGATLPSDRGRGAQGVLLARRLTDAAAMDCGIIVAETAEALPERPNPSYHNLRRAGFELLYLRPNYVLALDAREGPLMECAMAPEP